MYARAGSAAGSSESSFLPGLRLGLPPTAIRQRSPPDGRCAGWWAVGCVGCPIPCRAPDARAPAVWLGAIMPLASQRWPRWVTPAQPSARCPNELADDDFQRERADHDDDVVDALPRKPNPVGREKPTPRANLQGTRTNVPRSLKPDHLSSGALDVDRGDEAGGSVDHAIDQAWRNRRYRQRGFRWGISIR